MTDKKTLSDHMSDIAKQGHKKNPRPKSFYSEMGKKSALSRKAKKESNEIS